MFIGIRKCWILESGLKIKFRLEVPWGLLYNIKRD
jgi:hypothetical protein